MKNKLIFKTTLLSIGILNVMGGAAVAPALSKIAQEFSQFDQTLIKLVISLPALFVIFTSTIISIFVKNTSKKKILIIGLILYAIGGVGGIYSPNLFILLTFRAITGIAIGLIMPISLSLIADYYQKDEKKKMMGFMNAIGNLGGMIMMILSGFIANFSWRLSFSVYLSSILVFIPVLIFIPFKNHVTLENNNKIKLPKKTIRYVLGALLSMLFFYLLPTNMSLYIAQQKLGSTGIAGLSLGAVTLAVFFIGLFFVKLFHWLKRIFLPSAILMITIGFLLLSYANSLILVFLACILIGISFGIIMPYLINELSDQVSPQLANKAMAIITVGIFLGQFLSPFFQKLLIFIFQLKSIKSIFFTSSFFLLSIFVFIFVKSLTHSDKMK